MINKYHLARSCMMAPSEKGGVVDERLRVHGFKDLRVVDAGVFPGCAEGDHHECLYDGGKLSVI
jgi:choline dehydrogenase